MQVVTNEAVVSFVQRRARLFSIVGYAMLGILLIFLVVPFIPGMPSIVKNEYFTLAGIPLLLFFVMVMPQGRRLQYRWSAKPRVDQIIATGLKGYNDKYVLFNYISVGGKFIDHLLVSPEGLIVIASRDQYGKIGINGDKVRFRSGMLPFGPGMVLPQMGQPMAELAFKCKHLKDFISSQIGVDVPVQGVVVFTHQNAHLDVVKPAFPVLTAKDLKNLPKRLPQNSKLSSEVRRSLVDIFSASLEGGLKEGKTAKAEEESEGEAGT
jgi:hypothetical protein